MIDYGFGVSLGPLKLDHLDFYRIERNDKDCWRWCRQHTLIDEIDQQEWYERQRCDRSVQMFEVVDKANLAVGVCGLTDINHLHQRAEFSCWIAKGSQRKGYAMSTLKTLFKYGFEELNLNVIWGETLDHNPAIHAFQRLGMVFEGTRRDYYYKAGQFYDAHLLSIKKGEVCYNG